MSDTKTEATVVAKGTSAAPRIFLADDQEEMRRVVASMLKDEFQIVGSAEDGRGVLELLPTLHPDVLVLDIFMPGMNGIETALQLKESGSTTKMVFLTVHEDPDFLNAALSTGAQAYVLKAHLATDLVPALWNVLAGHTYVSPSMQEHSV